MHLIKQQNLNKKIKENFDYNFDVDERGLYSISITATCRSGKQIGERGGEDLRVEIDNQSFREIPSEKNIQLYNIPASWNGTKLKGLNKTVVFILWLEKGNHKITFIPDRGAKIENIKTEFIESTSKIKFDLGKQAEDGDRRPWYTFVLIDLPLKQIKAEVTTKWRFPDSDDVKLIIDGKTRKNKWSIFHRYWCWAGTVVKKLRSKEIEEKKFEENLNSGIHYIEFWADKTPTLHNVALDFGEFKEPFLKGWITDPNEDIREVSLRSEPSNKREDTIIAKISVGEEVKILEEIIEGDHVAFRSNIWHKVEHRGQEGYILSTYIDIVGRTTKQIQEKIIKKAKELKVDPEIILALAECESHFKQYAVSKADAKGIMQLAPILIEDLNDPHRPYYNPIDNEFDIDQNISGGIKYFKWLYYERYKNDKDRLRKALAAYNSGHNSVEVGKPLELELYEGQTKRIVDCVQNHLKKKTFKKILKSLAKVGIGLFLIVQLFSFYEALIEPENEIITYPGDNSANVIQTVRNTEPDTQLLEFPSIVWDKDVEKLAFFNKEAKLVKIIPIERLDLDLIFSEFVSENSIYIADEFIEFPENVFYFLISTFGYCGASGNCTWGLYQLDIEKDKLALIDDGIFGSGISFYLSPDNKNLAIERSVHGGICNYGNYFDVIDLENFEKTEVRKLMNQEKYWVNLIESLEWINNNEIKIKTEQFNCDDNEGPLLKRVLFYDVRSGKVRILESKISKFQGAG
ncbi:transglycosylase SLT domain-containing protein [Patescibacteria group bacterium]|nr:transglycosylase SLT domain-containing protein [Patescibacteria group bacterium]